VLLLLAIYSLGATERARMDLDLELYYAAEAGNVAEIRRILLAGGAEHPSRRFGWDDQTPLQIACDKGHLDAVRALLVAEADIDAKDCRERTPLHLVCFKNNSEIVKVLLEKGAGVRVKNRRGETPLHVAFHLEFHLEACHSEVTKLLLQHGADVYATDKDGKTPLQRACSVSDLQSVELLVQHVQRYDDDAEARSNHLGNALIDALRANTNTYRFPHRDHDLDADAMVDALRANTYGFPHRDHDLDAIANVLLHNGANVNATDDYGKTALHWACCLDDNLDIVEELVQRGADVYCKSRVQKTPFDEADGLESMTDFLLEHYEEKVWQQEGHLALHAILREAKLENSEVQLPIGTLSIAQLLALLESIHSQNPDSIHSQDSNGDLPLHVACRNNAPIKVLYFLVDQDRSTLLTVNSAGSLPIHEACRGGASLVNIKFLVEKGGVDTLFARDNQNALPIHEACRGGASLAMIKFLVKKGGVGTLDARDEQGALPVHVLCQSNPSVDVVKFLLNQHPSSISEETNAGALPFMLACEWSASESVLQILLTKRPEALAAMETYYSLEA